MKKPIDTTPSLSLVIPVYHAADHLEAVILELSSLSIPGGMEIILVDDGSTDRSWEVCQSIALSCPVPVTCGRHGRNFGEHAAVLTGLRLSRGEYVVTLDDDGQNPPESVKTLYEEASRGGFDVVFSQYPRKEHALWRNLGSRFSNLVSAWVLEKPRGLYLSSFRCLHRRLVAEICRYHGPFPYIDGLILQATRNLTTCTVPHRPRTRGRSGYNLRRLVRLWLNLFVNFSVMPLRLATFLGLMAGAFGFGLAVWTVIDYLKHGAPVGYGSLMAGISLFSGVQLVILGLLGEYAGRIYLTVNGRPQAWLAQLHVPTDPPENPKIE